MPAQTGRAAGFSLKAATLKHKDNEVQEPQDFSELPGGITGGIAKLKDVKFGTYKSGPNQGKQFFYAAGIVQSPRTAIKVTKTWQDDPPGQRTLKGGKVVTVGNPVEVVIAGQRTSIMVPLCDTKGFDRDGKEKVTPGEQHLADMVNELKLLGEELFGEHIGSLDQSASEAEVRKAYEELFAALVEAGVRFRFSTREGEPSKKYPNPRVFHTWMGTNGVEEDVPQDPGAGVEEDAVPSEEGAGDEPPAEDEAPAAEEEGGELPDDLDELAAICDDNDDPRSADAVNRLFEIAAEAGIDTEEGSDFQGAATYAEAAEMVKEAQAPAQDEETEQEEEQEPWVPAKGETCLAKVFDAKGKRYPKASEVVIISVNPKAETVTLKNNVTGKTVLDPKTKKPAVFKFSELSQG